MTPYNTGRVKIGKEFCVNPFVKAPPIVGDAFLLQGALLKKERATVGVMEKLVMLFEKHEGNLKFAVQCISFFMLMVAFFLTAIKWI
jgi:hypothetical protein